jgi:hypothetical protein
MDMPASTVRFYINRRHVKFLRGWFAWELQIGSVVCQFVHREHLDSPLVRDGEIRRLSVWRCPF